MKKTILFIIFFITYSQISSQDLISPLKGKSFGLNHHTNRDIGYFSHNDSNNNSIIIGTTERDSTFTDILTIKIDQDFNEIWTKTVSIPTNLSYDIPLKSFLNSNNELYVIGRSSFNQSSRNGLIFILKYGENGTVLYNKTIGNLDGSDYDDYGYLDVMLNNDGSLSLVYEPFKYQTFDGNIFYFLKIDNQGDIVSSFSKEIQHQEVMGTIDSENFYFLVKEVLDENNYTFIYKYYRILNEKNESILEITDSDFTTFYDGAILSEDVKLTLDSNKNAYLACPNVSSSNNVLKHKMHLSMIDANNEIKYALTTSDMDDYFLIGEFVNEQNENIVIANNLFNNTTEFLHVDNNNEIQTISSESDFLATGFKNNNDRTFFLAASNSNIHLFSDQLSLLKSFQTSDTYELMDFSKTEDNNIVTTGISYDKMFPESNFYTQLNVQAEKIDGSNILNNYSFSGIGTSRAFQQRIIVDNENNYLVLVTEKMGPEYLGIGGSNPPLNKRIIKYDSNLDKLWEAEVPEHIFNLVNHGGRDIEYFIDTNNNLYLNLPRSGNNYGLGYDLYKVTPNGIFEFINNSYIPDKFFANEMNIFIANNRFSSADESTIYKLDKNTGNLIEEINIGSEIVLDFFSIGLDNYFYTYDEYSNNTPDIIFLYKNGTKIFTRDLIYEYGIHPYEIDKEGTLYFSTSNQGWKINKLDINNSYSNYSTPGEVEAIKKFNNGNIFIYLENYSTLILDGNLNFITNGEDINSWNPYLINRGNYILFGTSFENSIRIIDQNGTVIKYFKIQGYLHDWYSKFDKEGNLITVGQIGNRIYTFNEYGWYRGFIHSYGILDNVLSVEDIDFNDLEKGLKIYPNPTSDILNIEFKNHDIDKVFLYDLFGKQLKEFNSKEISLMNLKSGIYIIKVVTTSNFIINSKVIKN